MAKPNYQFEKRKRDMEKKAKKEEKKKRKLENANNPSADDEGETPATGALARGPPRRACRAPRSRWRAGARARRRRGRAR